MFKKKTNVFFHKYNLTKTKIRFVSASRVTNARITIKKNDYPFTHNPTTEKVLHKMIKY